MRRPETRNMARRGGGGQSAARIAAVFGLVGVLAVACGSSAPSSTPGVPTTVRGPSSSSGAATTQPSTTLLNALADGDDAAVFERRYFGELAPSGSGSAADAGPPPFVAVGVGGQEAVAYLCDGDRGLWLSGPAPSDGVLRLRQRDGAATLTATPDGEGLRIEVADTPFGNGQASLTPAGDADALMRIEHASPDGEPIVGGIIQRGEVVRGVVGVSPVSATRTGPGGVSSSTTTSPSGVSTLPRIVRATNASRLTIDVVPRIPNPRACASIIDGLEVVIATLRGQRDQLQAEIERLQAQIRQFEAILAGIPLSPPEIAAQRTFYEQQIRGLQDRIRSLGMAIASLMVQIADFQVDLAEKKAGRGC